MTKGFAFVEVETPYFTKYTTVVDAKEYASAGDDAKIEVIFESNDYDEVIDFQKEYNKKR